MDLLPTESLRHVAMEYNTSLGKIYKKLTPSPPVEQSICFSFVFMFLERQTKNNNNLDTIRQAMLELLDEVKC